MMETKYRASKLCLIISGPTLHEAREQIRKANSRAGMLEFRLDQFHFTQAEAIRQLMESTSLPVIFTLRRRLHGGEFSGSRPDHLKQVKILAALNPAYFDLEYDLEIEVFNGVRTISPSTQLICSYHDFEHTPKELKALLHFMQEKEADIYKIATMANSSLDMMRMMRFLKENAKKGERLVMIAMGERGVPSRILGAVYGNAIHYTILTEALKVASGQLTVDVMVSQYHIEKLNETTRVLGLIGDPVTYSKSDVTHNTVLHNLGINAVYVKFQVNADEIQEFLEHAKKLDIHGLSVTMPLKELALRACGELSENAKKIGAVNTLFFKNKVVFGDNTDAKGALDVIEQRGLVAEKRVVLVGAGATAKAIACEAFQRGAKIIVLNRTIGKAHEIANEVKGDSGTLADFDVFARKGYDILINCTPFGMIAERAKVPIDYSALLPHRLVFDVIVTDTLSPFLVEARALQCEVIPGIEMFIQQAIEQFNLWFHNEVDETLIKSSFNQIILKYQDALLVK